MCGHPWTCCHSCCQFDAFQGDLLGKAGEGNRTPVCSMGSCRSTIELHPLKNSRFSIATCDLQAGNNHCHETTSSESVNVGVPLLSGAFPSFPADQAITPMFRGDGPA